jgi:16S rRNA processing protein RimM
MTVSSSEQSTAVAMAKISGLYGVRGWVKLFSYTDPIDNILNYQGFYLKSPLGKWRSIRCINAKRHGKGIVAQFEAVNDRDQARLLIQSELWVAKSQLPTLAKNDYYWSELMGLRVENVEQDLLGTVTGFLETGAHDVLVVNQGKEEILIPYVMPEIIQSVDLENQVLVVDWQIEE